MTNNRRTTDHDGSEDIVVDRAVKKVFAIFGVDIDSPQSVAEFQADLRFGRSLRQAAGHGFLAFIGLCAIGVGAALWAGITAKLGGH